MWLKMYPFLAYFILFCNHYNLVTANPIVGEKVRITNQGEHPSVVSIKRLNNTNRNPETDHVCTGVLITNQDVLTAAHCEEPFKEGVVCEISAGCVDIKQGQAFYAAWWISFAEWLIFRYKQPVYEENDIAIIRLSQAVPDYIPPVERAREPNKHYYGKRVSTAGFGSTDKQMYSRFLQTVELKVMPNEKCEKKIKEMRGDEVMKITENLLCATTKPYAVITAGNSGGPLFRKTKLIGIAKGTCPSHLPLHDPQRLNVYISVHYYNEYIDDVIANF